MFFPGLLGVLPILALAVAIFTGLLFPLVDRLLSRVINRLFKGVAHDGF